MGALKWFSLVFIGGGVGAMLRYAIGLFVVNNMKNYLPFATLIANIVAIAIMGWSIHYAESKFEVYPWLRALVLIGFCGGLSTFSTFSYETVLLLKSSHWLYAIANVLFSVVLGILILYPFIGTQDK